MKEKILAAKYSVEYYGMYLERFLSMRYFFKSLKKEGKDCGICQELNKLHEDMEGIRKSYGSKYLHILIFYELYTEEDEQIADNFSEFLIESIGNNDNQICNLDSFILKVNEIISYFKKRIKELRDSINNE